MCILKVSVVFLKLLVFQWFDQNPEEVRYLWPFQWASNCILMSTDCSFSSEGKSFKRFVMRFNCWKLITTSNLESVSKGPVNSLIIKEIFIWSVEL